MPDKQKFDPSMVSMIDYKLIKGQVDSPSDFSLDKVTGHHLTNNFELAFNIDDKLIKADYTVDIHTVGVDKIEEEASASFHFEYIYKVENFEELALIDGDAINLDPMLGNALASISYSTSRGILLTRLQGTALQNFVLPIINANELLPIK